VISDGDGKLAKICEGMACRNQRRQSHPGGKYATR
jgi:hypothetical protein